MTDIVELLRLSVEQHNDGTNGTRHCPVCLRHMATAADEIERLRGLVERYRNAARWNEPVEGEM